MYAPAEASCMKANKVLVVEDEALVAFEIIATLRKAGLETVGPVPTVGAALAAIEREEIGAALLDMNLNGVPSFAVAEALSKKATPFAFVTAYSRMALPDELRDTPLLSKPYQEPQLLTLARDLLGMVDETVIPES